MKAINISNIQAKKLIVRAQLLDDNSLLPPGKDGILAVVKKLGYIQIDTIAVIKRAHHHTLWSRCSDYQEEMLHDLQVRDRQVFEFWGHAMSYLPMSDYRYALPRMHNFKNPGSPWAKYQLQKCQHLLEPVLKRIGDEGPLSSSDFTPAPGKKGGSWWDWKPAKVALELLFWRGDLMISERRKFQKIYDLTERVLPDEIDTTMPTDDELGEFLVHRAISALGVAEEREIIKFMQPESARDADLQIVGKEQISRSLKKLLENGQLIQLTLEKNHNSVFYAFPESLVQESQSKKGSSRVYLLSPFDNMIIQRERIRRLFGFDYTLECYLPARKRRYGYFSLPILWGVDFIGRLDSKADRKDKTLIVRHLSFEPDFKVSDEFLQTFTEKLIAFTRFNQCERVHIERVTPKKFNATLTSLLGKIVNSP